MRTGLKADVSTTLFHGKLLSHSRKRRKIPHEVSLILRGFQIQFAFTCNVRESSVLCSRFLSKVFQVAWPKGGTSALFLTETLLQFLLVYPALMLSMSPGVWLKGVEIVCGTEN